MIGSCNGVVRQLDARTGKVQWETNARGSSTRQYFFHGDVLVESDRIIAPADDPAAEADAGVHAFERSSGRELWKYPAGRGVLGTLVGDGRFVFGYAANGDVIALDVASGKRLWVNTLKAPSWESPDVMQGKVFAGSTEGVLFALNAGTGRIEWQRNLGAPITTSIRTNVSGVYAGTSDGLLHQLAPTSGEVLSSLKLDMSLKPTGVPVISNDAVFVLLTDQGADHRAVVSVDLTLNRVRWRQAAPDRWSTSRVFASSKTIVLGTPSGEVVAFCEADGTPAWTHKLASAPIRSIGGSDETLYIGTPKGSLYAIRPPAACF